MAWKWGAPAAPAGLVGGWDPGMNRDRDPVGLFCGSYPVSVQVHRL